MRNSVLCSALAPAFVLLTSVPAEALSSRPSVCRVRPTAGTTAASRVDTKVFSSALTAVDAFFRTNPYIAAGLVCGVKASAADFVAQARDHKKRTDEILQQKQAAQEEVAEVAPLVKFEESELDLPEKKTDFQRNLAYILYGSLYQGCFQEFAYNHLYPLMFGNSSGILTVLSKVMFDLLIQTTLITLPIAYLSKALIYRYSFSEAFRRYRDDIVNHGLLKKYFSLWFPVQCLTFSVVPVQYRVTFIASVSFFWLIILSSIASKARNDDFDDECSLVDGVTCDS